VLRPFTPTQYCSGQVNPTPGRRDYPAAGFRVRSPALPADSSTGEMNMLRKLGIAVLAVASIGAAALAPTSASAFGGHGGWGHGGWRGGGWGWGPGVYVGGPYYYGGYGGCWVRRLVPTPWGPRWRVVNRCY